MKFSKWFFLVFFLPAMVLGQELPIWENNVYLYNRFTIGKDFQNVNNLLIQKDGSIVVKPYAKPLYRIGNNGFSEIFSKISGKEELHHIYYFDNSELFIFQKDVIIKKGNNEIRLLPIKGKISVDIPNLINNVVYFSVDIDEKKDRIFYSYDGATLKQILKTQDKNLRFISNQKEIYLAEINLKKNQTILYDFKTGELIPTKVYPFSTDVFLHFMSKESVFYEHQKKLYHYFNGKSSIISNKTDFQYHISSFYHYNNKKYSTFFNFNAQFSPAFNTSMAESVFRNRYSPETASLYFGTGNHLMRAFKFIRKYPRLYNNTNSGQIFSLNQTADGKIWAGSYNGNISVIENGKITESNIHEHRILNGGLAFGNKMILNAEGGNGILLFENPNQYKKISDTIYSFYNFISSKNTLYSGTRAYGLMYKSTKYLENAKIHWKFAGKKEGILLQNCLTIAEDRFGNIWTGRSGEGIAVYQPQKNKGKTWLTTNKEIPFGSMTMLKDTRNTLWMGTSKGNLVYWDGKHQDDFSVKNFKKINHPLLSDSELRITFIHQWKNWLVLGAEDRVLLFDLSSWYQSGKAIVKYLNPVEASFSNVTEQNTVFTDFRDQSLWFSTSDMLYQWDIDNWLKLPNYKVIPQLRIKNGEDFFTKKINQDLELKPTQNSFDIELLYQTKDNMPRFISGALVKKGDPFLPEKPSITNAFHFQNLSSGDYIFYALVCQQDGTFNTYEFPIEIEKFLWQKWWFWLLMSLFPLGFMFYYFQNKKEIEKRKKEIMQLNVNTLSNQFRPHFMLNALNSLGTEMDDKPHAEKVISRIGENINLMYDYSQNKKFYTSFQNEWKLVENTIEIQKIIFIKELEVQINHQELIPIDYKIPMGIVQVCVENALLHGIRHRKKAPYLLTINFSNSETHYCIDIIDKGVGRKKSAEIYNFKSKGTGLKNILALIDIINSEIPNAITLTIKDDVFEDENYPGTQVRIQMMKKINYEKFKI